MDTWLLEFNLKAESLEKIEASKIIKNISTLIEVQFGKECSLVFQSFEKGFLVLFMSGSGNTILVQGKETADNIFMMIDISTLETDSDGFKEKVDEFEKEVRLLGFIKHPRTPSFPTLPSLKRGRPFSVYDCKHGSIFQSDFDAVVYDEVSPFQHIRIMNSPEYGRCLFLDNDMNMSDSDLIYTQAITGFDREDYRNKSVLILGGGDGGILHYLRNRGPSMITMVEIDKMVIEASKIHLRGVCHDALDSLIGKNYEVIIGNCVKYLEKYVRDGRKFDYVINDLTAIPITTEPVGDHWDFLLLILSLSMKVLKDDGKYITQGNMSSAKPSLLMYENLLEKLNPTVKFSKERVCVPSYTEFWVFYTIWKDPSISA